MTEPSTSKASYHRIATTTTTHHALQPRQVERRHALRERQYLRDVNRHADAVDGQVGVGRDDGAAAEVHALAGQVASEAALLALESLSQGADGTAGLRVMGRSGG